MASQTSVQDRRPSPGLALNLNSNNPFRRAGSPIPPSYDALTPQSPPLDNRRISTNPFLDTYRNETMPTSRNGMAQRSPVKSSAPASVRQKPEQEPDQTTTRDLADLSLDQKVSTNNYDHHGRPVHPGILIGTAHHYTHSHEEQRRPQSGRAAVRQELDIFASPPREQAQSRRPRARPRRNSESSVFETKGNVDQHRRERRIQEREQHGKDKAVRSRSKRSKPVRGLDIIDKLDVSSLYGPGAFHHDGPFDACNPHRNRKGSRAAPMQAFPAGSANNVLGGSGPVNKQIDYDAYHGRAAQGYADYNETTQAPTTDNEYINFRRPPLGERAESFSASDHAFSAKENVQPVHGEITAGLGTSTFLEGTPASRAALLRRESETADENAQPGTGGLSRKRSIAQKFRGISRGRPGLNDPGRVRSPEARYAATPGPQSAGGRGAAVQELNPFFNEPQPNDGMGEKTGTSTAAVTAGTSGPANGLARVRTRTNSSPHRNFALPRRSDDWGLGDSGSRAATAGGNGGGLLGRVKSLRGKKPRPERFGTAP